MQQYNVPQMLPFLLPLRLMTQTKAFICISDFTLIVGGDTSVWYHDTDTVEVISPDPLSHEVPQCIKTLGNFPTMIFLAVGTTFGKLKGKWKLRRMSSPMRSLLDKNWIILYLIKIEALGASPSQPSPLTEYLN